MRTIWKPALVVFAMLCTGCAKRSDHGAHEDHDHDAGHEEGHAEDHEQAPRGPHGGRLFEEGGLAVELRIEESTGPPTFVAWIAAEGKPRAPSVGEALSVSLERFGGRSETIPFRIEGDRFVAERPVDEPHSFAATIRFESAGHAHTWSYEQIEFRVTLAPEAIERSKLRVAPAGPREIDVYVEAPGEVRLNGERVLHVRPRFGGLVRALPFRLGDAVRTGDTLAVVQSNESLTEFAVIASQSGTVIARDVAVGEMVTTETVMTTLADFSSVWADFAIYPQNAGRVRRGQTAIVRSTSGEDQTETGTISYVGPLLEQDTRVSYGRIVLPNPEGLWRPGLFVNVRVRVDRAAAAVAVPEEAIVRSQFGPAVFRAAGHEFELQPVVVGRTDGVYTEIVAGLEANAPIVVENTFLLKAELGKSEAHHDH